MQIVTREQLKTLPPGLYLVEGPTSRDRYYDVFTDDMSMQDLALYARVRPDSILPPCGKDDEIMVRSDGRVVITGWRPAPTEKG